MKAHGYKSKLKQKAHCRGCLSHWVHGVKDGKHNNWCCSFGMPANRAFGHCKNVGGKRHKPEAI